MKTLNDNTTSNAKYFSFAILRNYAQQIRFSSLLCMMVVSFSIAGASSAFSENGANTAQSQRLMGYYPYYRMYEGAFPKDMVNNGTIERLTDILAFGATIVQNGNGDYVCAPESPSSQYTMALTSAQTVSGDAVNPSGSSIGGQFQQFMELKQAYPNLKIAMTLGGFFESVNFHEAALTQASRETFVKSCVDMFIKGDLPLSDGIGGTGSAAGIFDGIHLNWEFPGNCIVEPIVGVPCSSGPEDKENFIALLQEFRDQLDEIGTVNNKHYELSTAGPGGIWSYPGIDIGALSPLVDFYVLMGYEQHSIGEGAPAIHMSALLPYGGDPLTGPKLDEYNIIGNDQNKPARLTVHGTVNDLIAGGLPKEKIIIAVPFYGYPIDNVANVNNGLFQPGVWNFGALTFPEAKALEDNPSSGYLGFDEENGGAHWIYNAELQVFVSYDDEKLLRKKGQYSVKRKLGGAAIWEIGQDSTGDAIKALDEGLMQ